MGVVWLAEQQHPVRRQVALKIVKAGMDTARVVARFEAEQQALAVMDHPAIAKVFDGGATPEGRPYFTMEYVRGEPITSYCDRQRLSIRERLELFIQLCEGVQHAHQKGIIHRDLKPSNVLVSVSGDHPVPRIIDFGIAKAMARPLTDRPLFTEIGGFLGTPEYMSPEQAELTPVDVDTRSDLYSLGVMLYELLVGTLPFDSEGLRRAGVDELRRTIREQDPVRPSTRTTRCDPASRTSTAERRRTPPAKLTALLRGDLDWITMKAIEKDRIRRYQTVNALALDLRRHLHHEPVSAGPPSALYRTRKFVRRHRLATGVASTLVVFLVAFGGVTLVQARRIARERDRANQEATAAREVADFLVGLFKVSDPSEARGNNPTAREILARGANRVEESLHDQPQVQARLQATIGDVYIGLGLYAEAESLLNGALKTQRQVAGEDSPETLKTASSLATMYWYQGKFDEAERLYLDVVQRRDRILGEDHPDTLRANFDLASTYLEQKRWVEGERLTLNTLEAQGRLLGPRHADTLSTLSVLQTIYFRQGRFAEAEPVAREVLEGFRISLGDDHPDTLKSVYNLATLFEASGRYQEAERLYTTVIEAERRILGEGHPGAAQTLSRLAAMYVKQRRYRDAESVALTAYRWYAARLGDDHEDTQRVIKQIADLYVRAGQARKAEEWNARLRKP